MIWIIGSGYMAREYCKVLQALDMPFTVIGRRESSVRQFEEDTGISAVYGGVESFIQHTQNVASHAIVCTPVDTLSSVVLHLMAAGVKSILVEKPGALSIQELETIHQRMLETGSNVLIGYNRRFYQSVLAAEALLKDDDNFIAMNFEITEWSHRIKDEPCSAVVKNKWMLSNTSHVMDLAFFIAGHPEELTCYHAGSIDWHSSASRFTGAGKTTRGAVFSYHGYWDGPGRWSLEFVSTRRKYILRPMEKLQIQDRGSVAIVAAEGIDYTLDTQFKPGLYLQTRAFLDGEVSRLCSIDQQRQAFSFYQRIAGYKKE